MDLPADYAMCGSTTCPSRRECRRNPDSGTQPAERQAWAEFDRHRAGADKCSEFLPLRQPDRWDVLKPWHQRAKDVWPGEVE